MVSGARLHVSLSASNLTNKDELASGISTLARGDRRLSLDILLKFHYILELIVLSHVGRNDFSKGVMRFVTWSCDILISHKWLYQHLALFQARFNQSEEHYIFVLQAFLSPNQEFLRSIVQWSLRHFRNASPEPQSHKMSLPIQVACKHQFSFYSTGTFKLSCDYIVMIQLWCNYNKKLKFDP
jgi:hypothetical protein